MAFEKLQGDFWMKEAAKRSTALLWESFERVVRQKCGDLEMRLEVEVMGRDTEVRKGPKILEA